MTPRDRAIEWAATVAYDRRTVVLDTETLGLKANAGLCDIAIVAMDGTIVLNTLVNPGRPIPADATAIHGITDADVAGAPTWREVYPDVVAVLGGRIVIAYNAGFDAAILDACCDAAELPALGGASWHCALKKYREFNGSRSTKRPGLKRWSLGEACAAMGVQLDGAHRALADAEATRLLVLAMAARASPYTAVTPMQAALLRRG